MKELQQLIDKLETYDFQCEAGPLYLCVDWQKLKVAAMLTAAGTEKGEDHA